MSRAFPHLYRLFERHRSQYERTSPATELLRSRESFRRWPSPLSTQHLHEARLRVPLGHYSVIEQRSSSTDWLGIFAFQKDSRPFKGERVVCYVPRFRLVFRTCSRVRETKMTRGARLQERRARVVWPITAWLEMPPKTKTKDTKPKNKSTLSQTVLFSNIIRSVDATNARPNKVTKPPPGTPTNETPNEHASNYLLTSLLHLSRLPPVSKSHYLTRKAREEHR